MATLTYVYSDSTAVLGPLATYAEPHSYDLCEAHASRLTAPRGWEVVRLTVDEQLPTGPSHDDLLALVEAVREAARPREQAAPRGGPHRAGSPRPDADHARPGGRAGLRPGAGGPGQPGYPGAGDPVPGRTTGRRAHLRVLGPVDDGEADGTPGPDPARDSSD